MKTIIYISLIFLTACTQQAFVPKDTTITLNATSGIKIKESASQSLGSSPFWTVWIDTTGWNVYTKSQADLLNSNTLTQAKAYTDSKVFGGVDAYTKAEANGLFEKIIPLGGSGTYFGWDKKWHNFSTDVGASLHNGGDLLYDAFTRTFSYTTPKNISFYNNDKNYGIIISSIDFTGTTTKTVTVKYIDGTSKVVGTFPDLQGSGGGITPQQLTDSLNLIRKQNDDLNKRIKKLEDFLIDTTHFGALINGEQDIATKAAIVKDSLKAGYVRYDLNINLWTGRSIGIETLAAKGLKIVLNINSNNNDADIAYEKDTAKYRKIVKEIIDKYYKNIALVAVENEPYNFALFHHNGNINDYVKLFKICADVCHDKNLKVTDGGLYGNQVETLTYRYLVSQGRQSDADFYASQCRMVPSQIKDAQQTGRNAQMENDINILLTVLDAVQENGDYCNFHVYTDTTIGTNKFLYPQLWYTAECFKFYTGKETISNETAQRNNYSPGIVTSMMQDFKYAGYPIVLFYSGEGIGGAVSFLDSKGKLRDNGKAFRDSKWNM